MTQSLANQAPHGEHLSPGAEAEICRFLRQQIKRGDFAPGDRVPSQLVLAEQFSVSRHVVRRALSRLQDEGLIHGAKHRSPTVRRSDPGVRPRRDTIESPLSQAIIHLCPSPPESGRDEGSHFMIEIDVAVIRRLRELGARVMSVPANQISKSDLHEYDAMRPRAVISTYDWQRSPRSEIFSDIERLDTRLVSLLYGEDLVASGSRFCFDHREGGRLIAQALIDRGCRSATCFWGVNGFIDYPWLDDRESGLREAAEALDLCMTESRSVYGIPYFAFDESGAKRWESAVMLTSAAVRPWLAKEALPDAVVCAADFQALVFMAALDDLNVPRDRQPLVVGYDYTAPSLVAAGCGDRLPALTVDKRNEEMGCLIAEAAWLGAESESDGVTSVCPQVIDYSQKPAVVPFATRL